jgi:hypothetical protein
MFSNLMFLIFNVAIVLVIFWAWKQDRDAVDNGDKGSGKARMNKN